MNTKQLIDKAVSLPVEERALVVDSLLRSLNQPESEIDNKWAKEAQHRLDELRSGRVKDDDCRHPSFEGVNNCFMAVIDYFLYFTCIDVRT